MYPHFTFLTLLLISLLTNTTTPSSAPVNAPGGLSSGITQITWTGFDKQKTTFTATAANTNFGLSLAPAILLASAGQLVYQETIQVEDKYNPKNKPPLQYGPWFVERRIMAGSLDKAGTVTEVSSTRLTINKLGVATSPAQGSPLPFPFTVPSALPYLEYRLGRIFYKLGPGKGPNGLPTTKQVIVYNEPSLQVLLSVDACQVKKSPATFRPLPCEFETLKLEILGNKGQVITTILPGSTAFVDLPKAQAKKTTGPPDSPTYYFDARWRVRRIHKPNYSTPTGYSVRFGITKDTDTGKEADDNFVLASKLALAGPVGTEFTIPLEINRGGSTTTHLLVLENDVTRPKFDPALPVIIRAESALQINMP